MVWSMRVSICFITESTSFRACATSRSCLMDSSLAGLDAGDEFGAGFSAAKLAATPNPRMRSIRIIMAIQRIRQRACLESVKHGRFTDCEGGLLSAQRLLL